MTGRLTIARVDGGTPAGEVILHIEDAETNVRLVDARLTFEAFAQAILGLAGRRCTVTVALPLDTVRQQG